MLWLWAATAWASGFEVAQQGATAGGTGHASTARSGTGAEMAGQAWANPAALADGEGLRISVGAALAAATVQARSNDPDDPWFMETVTPLGTPPHLYASYARGQWCGGVAVNTAFAGGVTWPDDNPLRFVSTRSAPRFVRIAPFVGIRAGRVQLSAGAHLDAGGLAVARITDHVVQEGSVDLDLRGRGFGVDGAVLWRATDATTLGLTYKGRTLLGLQGWADFDVPPPFAAGLPDQGVRTSMVLPDRIAAGVSVRTGSVQILADVSATLWSTNERLWFSFDDPDTQAVIQENAWRSTVALRAGAEGTVGPMVVRAGGYVDGLPEAPPPARTLGPSSPDGTRIGVTGGVGVAAGEHLHIDAFVEHIRILARTAEGPHTPAAAYAGFATVGGVSVGTVFN